MLGVPHTGPMTNTFLLSAQKIGLLDCPFIKAFIDHTLILPLEGKFIANSAHINATQDPGKCMYRYFFATVRLQNANET